MGSRAAGCGLPHLDPVPPFK